MSKKIASLHRDRQDTRSRTITHACAKQRMIPASQHKCVLDHAPLSLSCDFCTTGEAVPATVGLCAATGLGAADPCASSASRKDSCGDANATSADADSFTGTAGASAGASIGIVVAGAAGCEAGATSAQRDRTDPSARLAAGDVRPPPPPPVAPPPRGSDVADVFASPAGAGRVGLPAAALARGLPAAARAALSCGRVGAVADAMPATLLHERGPASRAETSPLRDGASAAPCSARVGRASALPRARARASGGG